MTSQYGNSKEAKVFILYHPAALSLFRILANLVRENYPRVDCILIRALHPYWKGFTDDSFLSGCDRSFTLPDAGYATNLISGLTQAIQFKRNVQKIGKILKAHYGKIDLYSNDLLHDSAYLPVNILLSYFYHSGHADKIFRIVRGTQPALGSQPKDRFHSIITAIYCITLNLFKVKTIRLPGITSFIYDSSNPIPEVVLENPYVSAESKETLKARITLPEPFLLLGIKQSAERDMVVIFGDAYIYENYGAYLKSAGEYERRLRFFFDQLKSVYQGLRLVYKPHLSDRGKLMSGVDSTFTVYEEQKDAESFLIENLSHIQAVYSFFSTSSVSASLMHIPSYHIFEYFFNEPGIKVFNDLARKAGWYQNPYLKKLASLDEIGCIDSVSVSHEGEGRWQERWLDFLK